MANTARTMSKPEKRCETCGKAHRSSYKSVCPTCYSRAFRIRKQTEPPHVCRCGLGHIYAAHSAYQAAKVLGIHKSTVESWTQRGIGRWINNHWHFTQHELNTHGARCHARTRAAYRRMQAAQQET